MKNYNKQLKEIINKVKPYFEDDWEAKQEPIETISDGNDYIEFYGISVKGQSCMVTGFMSSEQTEFIIRFNDLTDKIKKSLYLKTLTWLYNQNEITSDSLKFYILKLINQEF